MFGRLFNNGNARSSSDSADSQRIDQQINQLGRSASGGLSWSNIHRNVPHSVYWIGIEKSFDRVFDDATHEIFIRVNLKKLTNPLETARSRLLYRRQSDFRLPGMSADEVACSVGNQLIRFLLNVPAPLRVPGMYDLLPEREQFRCPWEVELNRHRNVLLVSQLRRLDISKEAYLDDLETYRSLGKIE